VTCQDGVPSARRWVILSAFSETMGEKRGKRSGTCQVTPESGCLIAFFQSVEALWDRGKVDVEGGGSADRVDTKSFDRPGVVGAGAVPTTHQSSSTKEPALLWLLVMFGRSRCGRLMVPPESAWPEMLTV